MASNDPGGKNPSQFEIKINGKSFFTKDQFLSGKELLELAELTPTDNYEILLKLTGKEYEPVELNEKVDLNQPSIETFEVSPKHELTIFLDDEPYKVSKCFMTPVEILDLDNKKPQQYYLKLILGHKEVTYKNDEHHKIGIVDNMKFCSCKKDPTGVS